MSSSSTIGIPKRVVLALEKIYDLFHRTIARVTGQLGKPMTPEIYHAIRHAGGITVMGRTLKIRKWRKPKPTDGHLRNLWQMVRRWMTPERPHTLVRIACGGDLIEKKSDGEGYFNIFLPLHDVAPAAITVTLPDSSNSTPVTVTPKHAGSESRCQIVSDIDDTVLISHAAKLFRMLAVTLFGNALTRQIFPGTPALYRSLKKGTTPSIDEENPISYVTSSPYNLHGLLDLIFKENDLPTGAYFMTDWGIDREKWFKKSHSDHKLSAIHQTLEWYPHRPAILIGDSGQHDIHIYAQIAQEYPDRIAQILIRNVSDEKRISQLRRDVEKIAEAGVPFSFFRNSVEAGRTLRAHHWITEKQLEDIVTEYEVQTESPLKEIFQDEQH